MWDPGSAPECSISSACNIDCIVYSVTGLLGSRKTFYKTADLSPLSTLTPSETNKKPTAGKPPGISWAENVPEYILSHCNLLTLVGDQCQFYSEILLLSMGYFALADFCRHEFILSHK